MLRQLFCCVVLYHRVVGLLQLLRLVSDAAETGHYAKVVCVGRDNISLMDPPIADIVVQELEQLYKRRVHA